MTLVKPIYRDLSHPDLLKKCLHGKTQNCNESFNNSVWTRCPKRVFVRLRTLELCAYDAVGSFNDGNIYRFRVLQHMGINDPGKNSLNGFLDLDKSRILQSEANFSRIDAKARGKNRMKRKILEEADDNEPDYGAGNF